MIGELLGEIEAVRAGRQGGGTGNVVAADQGAVGARRRDDEGYARGKQGKAQNGSVEGGDLAVEQQHCSRDPGEAEGQEQVRCPHEVLPPRWLEDLDRRDGDAGEEAVEAAPG